MEEVFITLKTATLAKEKGFNPRGMNLRNIIYNLDITFVTQSVLQKWLREYHKINVLLSYKPNAKKWDFIAYDMNLNGYEYVMYYTKYEVEHSGRRYDTYEEALEDGLIEGLNLI